ncbi:winged helix-turn-helix transcriptional regulator [Pseudofrankia sp. BMG5.37]|uniref:winged helix-turn-helix transcriptional regulator n=1 Tax=Pseudofrankia sp. BMG5.37 TaxID=3050035 RepID=UPI0037C5ADCA
MCELEARRLVARAELAGFPPRTRYTLTPAGEALRPLLISLYRTGTAIQHAVATHRP